MESEQVPAVLHEGHEEGQVEEEEGEEARPFEGQVPEEAPREVAVV